MQNIGIIGYGKLGQQLYELLLEANYRPRDLIVFDDNIAKEGDRSRPFADYKKYDRNIRYIVALGYKQLKLKSRIIEELKQHGCQLFTYIHSSVYISESAHIGDSVLLFSGTIVEQHARVSDGCICYYRTTLAHDCVLKRSVFLAPSVTVCGDSIIGSNSFIGAGTVVGNGINIGKDVQIGMGSSVQSDIADDVSCIGNPLRIVRSIKLK